MTRYFLTRLTLEGFRGINNEGTPLDIRFKPHAVNSVFAVNGIGKSSIFEALCYAIFDTVPKLDALQTQEKPQDYYCNRFHSQNAAVIDLEFTPDDGGSVVTIRVQRDSAGSRTVSSPSGHTDPEVFLVSLREAFALLDYRTFARFIEESPLERGRTFSALLGLSAYSDCRQALQAVSDTRSLNTDLNTKVFKVEIKAAQQGATQALNVIRSSYEKVTGNPVTDIDKLDTYADDISKALAGVELLKSHVEHKNLDEINFDEIKTAIKTAEGGDKRSELEQAIQDIAKLEVLAAHDLSAVQADQAKLDTLIGEHETLLSATRGDLFKRLYQSAQTIIEKSIWTEDNQCPLCESELASSISAHIGSQLTQYKEATAKRDEIKEFWATSAWRSCLSAYEEATPLAISSENRKFSGLNTKFASGDISKDDLAEAIKWTSDLTTKGSTHLTALKEKKTKLEAELPASLVQLTEQVEYARQFREAFTQYRDKQNEETVLQSRLDIRERWQGFITKAAGIFSEAESALSKARLADIDSEYKSMFKDIMQVGDVVPDLKRADEKQDLHVELSDFHGQHRLSARALLSESYRNALAISVFLAAAQSHTGVPRFVVLDDVTSSFDAGHQLSLMELIRTKLQQPQNTNGLQFIILSHDGLLEKYFDRLNATDQWHHNKLQGSPPMGAVLNQTQGADRLKTTITAMLSAGQITQAEPLIRQYLEYKLQQIIRRVNIPVPVDFAIKETNRMVGNCLEAIETAIDLHDRAGILILDAQQKQDVGNVHVPAIVGNWVSHYETGSGNSLSAAVLLGVLTAIDALVECFRYDDASGGTTVRKWYRSLSTR